MGWLQDIVPNHMAYHTGNPWIFDVLERGKKSIFYNFFDIIPQSGQHSDEEKILLPFLGKPVGECIQDKEIVLVFTRDGIYLQYFTELYPVATEAYQWIAGIMPGFYQTLLAWSQKIASYATLPYDTWLLYKKKLLSEIWDSDRLKEILELRIAYINQRPELISQLLNFQHYEMIYWKASRFKMNYRRFFTVNSLICLRMEDDSVFNTWHTFLLSLSHQGFIQGFRIDHIDGLYNPSEYVKKLRDAAGDDAYIVAEKIQQENEDIPPAWPLQGTTGYDFLSHINQLMTFQAGKIKLLQYYHSHISSEEYADLVFEKKYIFLRREMNGELDNLLRWLKPCIEKNTSAVSVNDFRDPLAVFMSAFPVYRAYPDSLPLNPTDTQYVEQAFRISLLRFPQYQSFFHIIQELFQADRGHPLANELLFFIRRLAQYTGPLAAKGIEDTLFYNFNALLGLNEVGDSPARLPVRAQDFHALMQKRSMTANLSLNASSTHDTKRGEDNRLRINLICLYAEDWIQLINKIKKSNESLLQIEKNKRWPSLNDEYMIYQALIGAIPHNLEITENFLERFKSYLSKALREAKNETNWDEPNIDYEDQCFAFVKKALQSPGFKNVFFPFLTKIIDAAFTYSLSQTVIKLTAPGIPDIYQGSELWDFSLVDPDNRLPVDFIARKKLVKELIASEDTGRDNLLKYVMQNREQGAQKLLLIRKILRFRKQNPDIFNKGNYIPLVASDNVIGYSRKWGRQTLMILAPLPSEKADRIFDNVKGVSGKWENLIHGKTVEIKDTLNMNLLLKEFPVAVLQLQND
ncbi:MAG: malto-oligosyltrehalose synthase [Bacteroidota bacterium]|nr:malto-oligosyltrehalose synthase [Bacteroidota bacterium]